MNFRSDIAKELDERVAASPPPSTGGWAKKSAPQAKPAYTGDAGEYKFDSGKHAGKTIAQVYSDAPDYLEWLTEKSTGNSMKDAKEQAQKFLDTQKAGV